MKLLLASASAVLLAGAPVLAMGPSKDEALIRLLDQRSCKSCRLQDADLVHADLRDAELERAQLQRANLSQAKLDGANLRGADLSFTTLLGASLRGADLRGAKLEGTDFREADLSGAQFDPDALARSHWQSAVGVTAQASSYAAMHNAGVEAALQGRFPEAEEKFGNALLKQPDAAVTWLARAITRAEQAKRDLASQDMAYAAALYEQNGDKEMAEKLRQGAEELGKSPQAQKGNGFGARAMQGLTALLGQLAPIAVKALSGF